MNPYQNTQPLRKEHAEEYNRRYYVGAYVEAIVSISKSKTEIDTAYRIEAPTEYLFGKLAELDRLKLQAEDYRKQAEFLGADLRGLTFTNGK